MEIPDAVLSAAREAVVWGKRNDKNRCEVYRRLDKELARRDVARASDTMKRAAVERVVDDIKRLGN
jgi:predicted Fe-S protein YdhL (DUF1289 family)